VSVKSEAQLATACRQKHAAQARIKAFKVFSLLASEY